MRRPGPLQLVDLLPLVAAATLSATIAQAWAVRLPHPYDLEWMEGGMLAHAWRLQRGLELYPEPGPDFVAFVYPPGYSAVLALLGGAFDLGHPLGRALAVFGTLAAAAAIVVGVARHGRSLVLGLVAAAVFLGTWPDSGAFFDLVRPDSLSVALLGWALVVGLERGRGAPVAAGLLLAAAWACKHNAAAYGLAMLVGVALRDGWRRGVIFGLSAGLPALAVSLWMQLVSEGRFLAYILGLPASHPMVGARIVPGTPGELVSALPVAVALGAALVLARAPAASGASSRVVLAGAAVGALGALGLVEALPYPTGVPSPDPWERWLGVGALGAAFGAAIPAAVGAIRRRAVPWEWAYGGGVAVTALVTAALMRGHHGGFLNVLMPLHWVVAFGAGVAAARLREAVPGRVVPVVTAVALALQLGAQHVALDVERLLPTAEDRAAGDRLVARIAEQCEGRVLSPYAAWLPVQAGFAPSLHLIAVWDIHHAEGPFRPHMANLRAAARQRYWNCAVLGGRQQLGFGLQDHYTLKERLFLPPRALVPRTGWRVRPTELHVPR